MCFDEILVEKYYSSGTVKKSVNNHRQIINPHKF
jgi:hypothetical protein